MRTLAASWLTSFRPFTTFHLVVGLTCLLLIGAACRIGVRTRGSRFERRFRASWAIAIVLTEIVAYAWWLQPAHFRWEWTLPLHLCSIVVWIAPIALLLDWRIPRALLYFWGLALCLQGFVSPIRQDGLASPPFWFFWLNHLEIVGSAVYMVWVLQFRPSGRDYAVAVIGGLAYVALVVPLDAWFGWNYGALGRDLPGTQSVLDHLGPWPWRVGVMVLIGATVSGLLWLVWELPRRWRTQPARGPG